jgi:two-component system, response regulator
MQEGHSETILVVEGNPDQFELLKLAAKRTGITAQLKHAGDGTEAVRYLSGDDLHSNRIDYPLPTLILSGLKMFPMDGLELLRWVRAQPFLSPIPFIVFTSSTHPEAIQDAYTAGANCFVFMPVEFTELAETLSAIIRFWRPPDHLRKAAD